MIIHIPYGTLGISFELSDRNIRQIIFPLPEKTMPDVKSGLIHSIENPSGTPPLQEIINSKGDSKDVSVAIVCDDNTRPTPQKEVLDILIPYLQQQGILLSNVRIIIATGAGRSMTRDEIYIAFGSWISPVLTENHNCNENLVNVGRSSSIGDIFVNKALVQSDLKIALGSVMPHPIYGFTGGSTIILPGAAALKTIHSFHRLALSSPGIKAGLLDNPLRKESDYVADLIKLDFTINIAQNAADGICGIFCGYHREAFRQAARYARKILEAKVMPDTDILIAGSYPKDADLWQTLLVFLNVSGIVHDGGAIVIVTPCSEGCSRGSGSLPNYIGKSSEELKKQLDDNSAADVSSAVLAYLVRKELQRVSACFLSGGIKPADAQSMHLDVCGNINEILTKARRKYGEDVTFSIAPYGGKIFPVISHDSPREN